MAGILEHPSLAAPAWLESLVDPLCTSIGFSRLASVLHIALIACAASFALQSFSHVVSPILFPKTYPKIRAKQDDWDLHVVGWAYALVATPLALSLILHPSPEIVADPLYGFGVAEGRLAAIATGYFTWDTIVSAQHMKTQGLGFFLHGIGCGTAFLFTLKPFLMFCGPNFLIWELSTIFLNAHWYLDKFGLTGSTAQLINGVFLISSYIGARLLWGTYNSFQLFALLFGPKAADVGGIKYLYIAINILTNGLNFFWFRSMLLALKKRFVKADPNARKQAIEVDGKLAWGKDKKAN